MGRTTKDISVLTQCGFEFGMEYKEKAFEHAGPPHSRKDIKV